MEGCTSVSKCKKIGELALMATERGTASVSAEAGRKRKVSCSTEELSSSSRSLVQLRSRRRLFFSPPENSSEKAASSNSNDPYASCCSSNGSIELDNGTSKFVDLEEGEEESVEVGISTCELERCRERRETMPLSSEVRVESAEMGSASRASLSAVNSHRQSTDKKMPSEVELEEFFSVAEKKIQEQFVEKYNFDILEEKPLEGRYEWVRVKP